MNQQSLTYSLASIEIAEPAQDGVSDLTVQIQQIKSSIVAKFMEFMAAHADLAPSKEVVLDMLSKAIDTAFTALNKPFIASILKPIVKAQILVLAGQLYDSIFTPQITV